MTGVGGLILLIGGLRPEGEGEGEEGKAPEENGLIERMLLFPQKGIIYKKLCQVTRTRSRQAIGGLSPCRRTSESMASLATHRCKGKKCFFNEIQCMLYLGNSPCWSPASPARRFTPFGWLAVGPAPQKTGRARSRLQLARCGWDSSGKVRS